MRVSSSFARASTSGSGTSTVACSTIASSAAARNSLVDALLVELEHALGDVLAQLLERVEAGRVRGEVVVEVGQVLVLDVLDLDRELRVLAGDVLGAVVLGERRLDDALLAGDGADEALLEAGDEVARAELDELVAALAAGERLAADGALEVDRQEVAVLRGALDDVQVGEALAQLLDLVVDGLGVDGRLAAADLDAAVRAELGRRAHADLEGERQRLALVGHVAEVDLRIADGRDAGVVDRLHVPAGRAGRGRPRRGSARARGAG